MKEPEVLADRVSKRPRRRVCLECHHEITIATLGSIADELPASLATLTSHPLPAPIDLDDGMSRWE